MNKIDSIKHPLIVAARNLNKPAARLNHFLLEGEDIIQWALESGISIDHVFISAHYTSPASQHDNLLTKIGEQEIAIYQCSEGIMKKINNSKYLTPIIAVAKREESTQASSDAEVTLLLENLQDQGNLGTIVRTSCALGIKNIITTGLSCDLYNRKTMTASRGSVFKIHQKRYQDSLAAIEELKAQGYQIIATSPHGTQLQSLLKLDNKPVVLLVGNETHGVSQQALSASDQVVQIPMHSDVESLNVGVATGISLYELKLKVLIAMLTKKIRSTLGRELGVTHWGARQVLDQELLKIGNYNSDHVVLMMIMVCDEAMELAQIERDLAVFGDELDALMRPLLAEDFIADNKNGSYSVTSKGEEFLGKVWHIVEEAEKKVFAGFSGGEIKNVHDYLWRMQENCQSILR